VDIVFTNLPDTPDVESVVRSGDGILSAARPGLIWVDNSTIQPAAARQLSKLLAEKGALSLDAPVSGGDIGARNATLTIMVGGPAQALEKAMPAFQAMGKTITHVGQAGAGQVAKAANQIMVAAQMVAMGELLVFSQKAGVDPVKVVEAIKAGAAQCWTLDMKPKDLNIVLETAREYGIPLPSAAVDAQLYNAMLQNDMGELDNSAVVGIIEELAGETLQTEPESKTE
jgi:2-hydroxy-3-oxopropionate reductase